MNKEVESVPDEEDAKATWGRGCEHAEREKVGGV